MEFTIKRIEKPNVYEVALQTDGLEEVTKGDGEILKALLLLHFQGKIVLRQPEDK